MADTKIDEAVPSTHVSSPDSGTASAQARDLITANGRTSITDHVVAKITSMIAREIGGVHRMGNAATRPLGATREATSGTEQGVRVELDERQTAVAINLVVDYGTSIPDLAAAVRRNVIAGVERMTGLEVTEVNITVDDIHLPGDEEPSPEEPAEPTTK